MPWFSKKKVLVPIDFSDHCFRALEAAREMVDRGSQLYAVHVLHEILVTEPGVIWNEIDDQSRMRHVEEAIREKTSEPRYEGLNVAVLIGDRGQKIVDFAAENGIELIVMPSHGRTGLKHLLIGSVAERVVRLAHCPVLVLRS
ncbi:MAG: universal stress protein [Pirellulales bacterium]